MENSELHLDWFFDLPEKSRTELIKHYLGENRTTATAKEIKIIHDFECNKNTNKL